MSINNCNNRIKLNNEIKYNNLKKFFKIINIDIDIYNLENIEIDREILLNKDIIENLNKLVDECKILYNSSKLTSLHSNRLEKQKFPSVNLLRQVLKCNKYYLCPKKINLGYSKTTGKKIIKRTYIIKSMEIKDTHS